MPPPHTLLYLHETIDLWSGRSDEFTEVYHPMMTEPGRQDDHIRDGWEDSILAALAPSPPQ